MTDVEMQYTKEELVRIFGLEILANWTKLADFVEKNVPPSKFGMHYFFKAQNETFVYPQSIITEYYTQCGTVACMVGHGPLAGFKAKEWETWNRYSSRVFGCATDMQGLTFHFLFGGAWTSIDDTPEGAVARIRWALENGIPSINAVTKMLAGQAPLCYVDMIRKK